MTGLLNRAAGDALVFKEELEAVLAGLHTSDEPPLCRTGFSEWLGENVDRLGRRSASELARHYR